LQRMRELAVQASNGTNNETDKSALNSEVTMLKNELTRIADTSQFNGSGLLDGSMSAKTFQIGANGGETVQLTIGNMDAASLGYKVDGTAGSVAGESNSTQLNASVDSVAGGTVAILGGGSSGSPVTSASSVVGTKVVAGKDAFGGATATSYTDTFTLSAAATDGDEVSWDLGADGTIAYTASGTDDLSTTGSTATAMAAGLSAASSGSYNFTASGDTITATRTAAGDYSAAGTVTVTQTPEVLASTLTRTDAAHVDGADVVAATSYTDSFDVTVKGADGDAISWVLGADETVALG
jgi:flagellin